MITQKQSSDLLAFRDAAVAAEHPFPEFVACEAALETTWFSSFLYLQGHNAFGNKQRVKPVYRTIQQKTYEEDKVGVKHGLVASFIAFPDVKTCIAWRLQMLKTMGVYYEALHATTGIEFIRTVSAEWEKVDGPEDKDAFVYDFGDGFFKFKSPRWSTGHDRALIVLSIYHAHKDLFTEPAPPKLDTEIAGSGKVEDAAQVEA